jgi:iron(III) transport system substrate-binding protein
MKKLIATIAALLMVLCASVSACAEGKVTVYAPSPAGLADKIAAAFTKKTGIEVEMFQGTTGEILARMEAEEANPVVDVVILASWSDGLTLKADGKLESYAPANAERMNAGWYDAEATLWGYSASAVGVIYNTTIYPELSADWAELGSEAYKDDICIPDPEKSGACKDFLSGFVTGLSDGQAILDSWVKNGLTVPGANKAALEAVTTGEKGILIAGVDYNGFSSVAKGEPLSIYYPAGGTVVNPRPAMIVKTAPNMDNAKLFMDFLLSDEAQQLVANAYLLPGLSDVTCDGRTNLSDIPQIVTDWSAMMSVATEVAQNLNAACK